MCGQADSDDVHDDRDGYVHDLFDGCNCDDCFCEWEYGEELSGWLSEYGDWDCCCYDGWEPVVYGNDRGVVGLGEWVEL